MCLFFRQPSRCRCRTRGQVILPMALSVITWFQTIVRDLLMMALLSSCFFAFHTQMFCKIVIACLIRLIILPLLCFCQKLPGRTGRKRSLHNDAFAVLGITKTGAKQIPALHLNHHLVALERRCYIVSGRGHFKQDFLSDFS